MPALPAGRERMVSSLPDRIEFPDVAKGDHEFAAAIKADLADSESPVWYRTTMPASEASNTVPFELLVQLAFNRSLMN